MARVTPSAIEAARENNRLAAILGVRALRELRDRGVGYKLLPEDLDLLGAVANSVDAAVSQMRDDAALISRQAINLATMRDDLEKLQLPVGGPPTD